MIPLTYMMSLSAIIFAIGVAGVIIRRNILVMFMSIELMLNAVNLAFIAIGSRLGSMDGSSRRHCGGAPASSRRSPVRTC